MLGDIADRFEPAQPLRQRVRHVLGAQPVGLVLLGQQQARFQVGEPRRHHQVIGGKLQAQLSRRFDEGEILVGKREDRDFGEIDFLLARQREQKIEWALKTLDVDDQRRLVGGAFRQIALELQIFGVHATAPAAGQTSMEMSSLIKRPRKPIESQITPPTIAVDKVAGAMGSLALNIARALQHR